MGFDAPKIMESSCGTGRKSPQGKPWNFKDRSLLLARLKERPFGTVQITGEEIIGGKYLRVEGTCSLCGVTKVYDTRNLLLGKSKSCACNPHKRYKTDAELRIADRFHAMYQRCTNPKAQQFKDYGGRGIRCGFSSAEEFVRYITAALPHESYLGVQIDRIDNNGNYVPGNLRLVSCRENLVNSRRTRWVEYNGRLLPREYVWHVLKTEHPDFPFSVKTTVNLLTAGLSVQEILSRKKRVGGGRKCTTSSTPDPAIVSLCATL